MTSQNRRDLERVARVMKKTKNKSGPRVSWTAIRGTELGKGIMEDVAQWVI